jgi:hypothetical protein
VVELARWPFATAETGNIYVLSFGNGALYKYRYSPME